MSEKTQAEIRTLAFNLRKIADRLCSGRYTTGTGHLSHDVYEELNRLSKPDSTSKPEFRAVNQ